MPPEYLAPGVYVEEVSFRSHAIPGVPTSTTGFVGYAVSGPLHEPVRIHGWEEYERCFGGLAVSSPLSYAVRDFFSNGGTCASIVRVAHPDAFPAVIHVADAGDPCDGLVLEAATPGAWGNQLSASVSYDGDGLSGGPTFPAVDETFFDLTIEYRAHPEDETVVRERFLDVSTQEDHPRFLPHLLAAESSLVRVRSPMPSRRPVASVVPSRADPASGRDGGELDDYDVIGDATAETGLFAFRKAGHFGLLCVPPKKRDEATTAAVWAVALSVCREARAMLIVDPDPAWGALPADAVGKTIAGREALGLVGEDAQNAALYFPCVRQADPLRDGQLHTFAPCGVVAGAIARMDAAHGVWKAPAGVEASLKGVAGLQVDLSEPEAERLDRLGINSLRSLPTHGPVIWGARTLRGADRWSDEYKYLPVRRLALFLEECIFEGTRWVVFEPNDEVSWARIRLTVGAFMHGLFREGAFRGRTPAEAFAVRCDLTTTTAADIDAGNLNIVIGFAPLAPAEFVVIRIQHRFLDNASRTTADAYGSFRLRLFWEGAATPIAGFSAIAGLDPSTGHGRPIGSWKYEPITLERGVTHDAEFEAWASLIWNTDPPSGAAPQRRNLAIAMYDETGRLARRYYVRCAWISEFRALPDLDAAANAITIRRLTLEHEGWTRDGDVAS